MNNFLKASLSALSNDLTYRSPRSARQGFISTSSSVSLESSHSEYSLRSSQKEYYLYPMAGVPVQNQFLSQVSNKKGTKETRFGLFCTNPTRSGHKNYKTWSFCPQLSIEGEHIC